MQHITVASAVFIIMFSYVFPVNTCCHRSHNIVLVLWNVPQDHPALIRYLVCHLNPSCSCGGTEGYGHNRSLVPSRQNSCLIIQIPLSGI